MKFFFGLLAFIAATVVVVLLIVSFWRDLDGNSTSPTVSSTYDLASQEAKDTIVRYRAEGPVVADENFRELRITISKNARTLEILKGYNRTVVTSKTYPNSEAAYASFIGALDAANFSDSRNNVTASPDTTCVTGNKYYFELSQGSTRKVDSWTASCSLGQGTYAGNFRAVELFKAQIPEYSQLTSGLSYSL